MDLQPNELSGQKEDFVVIKNIILKSSELLSLLQQKDETLKKGRHAFKILKGRMEENLADLNFHKTENQALKESVESLELELQKSNKLRESIQAEHYSVKQQYNTHMKVSQTEILDLQEKLKQCTCNILPYQEQDEKAVNKLQSIKKKYTNLKISEHTLRESNNSFQKKINNLEIKLKSFKSKENIIDEVNKQLEQQRQSCSEYSDKLGSKDLEITILKAKIEELEKKTVDCNSNDEDMVEGIIKEMILPKAVSPTEMLLEEKEETLKATLIPDIVVTPATPIETTMPINFMPQMKRAGSSTLTSDNKQFIKRLPLSSRRDLRKWRREKRQRDTILEALKILQRNNMTFTISNIPNVGDGINGEIYTQIKSEDPFPTEKSTVGQVMACFNPNCIRKNNLMLLTKDEKLLGYFTIKNDTINDHPDKNIEDFFRKLKQSIGSGIHTKNSDFESETEPEIERLFDRRRTFFTQKSSALSETDSEIDSGWLTATSKSSLNNSTPKPEKFKASCPTPISPLALSATISPVKVESDSSNSKICPIIKPDFDKHPEIRNLDSRLSKLLYPISPENKRNNVISNNCADKESIDSTERNYNAEKTTGKARTDVSESSSFKRCTAIDQRTTRVIPEISSKTELETSEQCDKLSLGSLSLDRPGIQVSSSTQKCDTHSKEVYKTSDSVEDITLPTDSSICKYNRHQSEECGLTLSWLEDNIDNLSSFEPFLENYSAETENNIDSCLLTSELIHSPGENIFNSKQTEETNPKETTNDSKLPSLLPSNQMIDSIINNSTTGGQHEENLRKSPLNENSYDTYPYPQLLSPIAPSTKSANSVVPNLSDDTMDVFLNPKNPSSSAKNGPFSSIIHDDSETQKSPICQRVSFDKEISRDLENLSSTLNNTHAQPSSPLAITNSSFARKSPLNEVSLDSYDTYSCPQLLSPMALSTRSGNSVPSFSDDTMDLFLSPKNASSSTKDEPFSSQKSPICQKLDLDKNRGSRKLGDLSSTLNNRHVQRSLPSLIRRNSSFVGKSPPNADSLNSYTSSCPQLLSPIALSARSGNSIPSLSDPSSPTKNEPFTSQKSPICQKLDHDKKSVFKKLGDLSSTLNKGHVQQSLSSLIRRNSSLLVKSHQNEDCLDPYTNSYPELLSPIGLSTSGKSLPNLSNNTDVLLCSEKLSSSTENIHNDPVSQKTPICQRISFDNTRISGNLDNLSSTLNTVRVQQTPPSAIKRSLSSVFQESRKRLCTDMPLEHELFGMALDSDNGIFNIIPPSKKINIVQNIIIKSGDFSVDKIKPTIKTYLGKRSRIKALGCDNYRRQKSKRSSELERLSDNSSTTEKPRSSHYNLRNLRINIQRVSSDAESNDESSEQDFITSDSQRLSSNHSDCSFKKLDIKIGTPSNSDERDEMSLTDDTSSQTSYEADNPMESPSIITDNLKVETNSVILDSPMSPEPEESPKVKPSRIPKVPTINFNKVIHRINNKLMPFSVDEMETNEIIAEFSRESVDDMTEIIMSRLSNDLESPDTSSGTKPPLSNVQKIMLGYLLKLEDSTHPGILDKFLQAVEHKMFNNSVRKLYMVEPLTRVYTCICRIQLDVDRIRMFLVNMFYFTENVVVPALFYVLTIWPDIFPKASETKQFPMAKVMVQLIYLKQCFARLDYRLLDLRRFLNSYYGYPTERWNCDEVFEECFEEYKRNPSDVEREFIFLLFLKNKPTHWVRDKVKNHIQPWYLSIPSDKVHWKSNVMVLMGKIYSQFTKKTDVPFVHGMSSWLNRILIAEMNTIVQTSIKVAQQYLPTRQSKEAKNSESK